MRREDEWTPVYTCTECGEAIYKGEQYFMSDCGEHICYDCMRVLTALELLQKLRLSLETA